MPPLPAVDTPIGRLWPLATEAGVFAITRSPAGIDPPAPLDLARAREAARVLRAWFDGALRELALDLDLRSSTPFDREVYRAVRSIPFGETASYAEIAIMAGHPGAARAVGNALARCEVAPVVPCHRVIHADGRIGGWGSDPETKRWLLDRERGVNSGLGAVAR